MADYKAKKKMNGKNKFEGGLRAQKKAIDPNPAGRSVPMEGGKIKAGKKQGY